MFDCDSDSDDAQNSAITFPSQGTIISAKGPNISRNLTNFSIPNNALTSTMNVPWNMPMDRMPMDKTRYGDSIYDQRSRSESNFGGNFAYSRRETSPGTTYSAAYTHARNMHDANNKKGFSSHRSMYNGRHGSPNSVRTMNSNASIITAADIVEALKTRHFNKKDFVKISKAYNKYMKRRIRKRAKLRLRAPSTSSCGSSHSSPSSDDGRSIRSYRSAMPGGRSMMSGRQSRLDLQDFRRALESDIYRDCTSNLKQNSLKNKIPYGHRNIPDIVVETPQNQTLMGKNQAIQIKNQSGRFQNQSQRAPNQTILSQKERFTDGFLLPFQRFNQSLVPISEKPCRSELGKENRTLNNRLVHQKTVITGSDSEPNEIFTEKIPQNFEILKKKRHLEDDNISESESKKRKLASPKNKPKSKALPPKINKSLSKNDFVFRKPMFPVKKLDKDRSVNHKPTEQSHEKNRKQTKEVPDLIQSINNEKVISKSSNGSKTQPESEPLPEMVISHSESSFSRKPREQLLAKSSLPLDKENECQDKDETIAEVTDLSARPSFIKRKLFSQKVDMGDKNSSSDGIESNSPPADVYSEIQREKNRTRKLAMSQSCLNRDVLRDDSNLLDLIHKIVPSDRLNVTEIISQSKPKNGCLNATTSVVNGSNVNTEVNSNSKWEMLEAIAVASCDNTGDISETYTDEEIFKCNEANITESVQSKNKKIENVTKKKAKTTKQTSTVKTNIKKKEPVLNCKIVTEKLPPQDDTSNLHNKNQGVLKKIAKSFWDTDIESDIENCRTPLKLPEVHIKLTPLKLPEANNNVKPVPSFPKSSKDKRVIEKSLHSKECAPPTNTDPAQQISAISSKGKNTKHPNENRQAEKTRNLPPTNTDPAQKISAILPSKGKNTKHPNENQQAEKTRNVAPTNTDPAQKISMTLSSKGKNTKHPNENRQAEKTSNLPPTNTDPAQKISMTLSSKGKNTKHPNENGQAEKTSNLPPTNTDPAQKISKNTKHPNENGQAEKSRNVIPNNPVPKQSTTKPTSNSKKKASPNKSINKGKQLNKKITLDNNISNNSSQNKSTKKKKNVPQDRLRPCRMPKISLCCTEQTKNDNSLNDSTDTVYRNLRGRVVNLSTPMCDVKNKTLRNKALTKLCKNEDDSLSDLSFTLTSSKSAASKPGNKSISTRHSERIKKNSLNKSDNNLTLNRTTRMCNKSSVTKKKK